MMFTREEPQDLQALIQNRYQGKQDFDAGLLSTAERVQMTKYWKRCADYLFDHPEAEISDFIRTMDNKSASDFINLIEKGTVYRL